MVRSGFATLIISNEEINDMKIVKSLEESGLFIKGISETRWRNCIMLFLASIENLKNLKYHNS